MILIKDELFDHYLNDSVLSFDEEELVNFLNLLNEHLVELKKADDVRLSVEIFLLHYINEHKNKDSKVEVRSQVNPNNIKETSYVRPAKEEKTISTETVEKENKEKTLSTEAVQKK